MTDKTDRSNSLLDDHEWEILWGAHTGNVPYPWIEEPWIGVDKDGIVDLEGRFHVRHLMTILQSVGKKLNPPFLYGDPVFRAKGRTITDRGGNEICTTNSSDLAEFIARTMSIGRFVEISNPGTQECKLNFKREDIVAVLAQVRCYAPSVVTAVEELVVALLVSYNVELKAILDNMGKDAIHVHEGGGPEDFVASLALSVTKLQKRLEHYRTDEALKQTDGNAPIYGEGYVITAPEPEDPARPRVKLIPVKTTWSCPKCNHQNTYNYGIVSDPQNVCKACGQEVTPGAVRETDLQQELQRLYDATLSPSRLSYDSLRWWDEFPYVDGKYLSTRKIDALLSEGTIDVDELVYVEGEHLYMSTTDGEVLRKVDWRKDFVGAKFFGPIPADPPKNQS